MQSSGTLTLKYPEEVKQMRIVQKATQTRKPCPCYKIMFYIICRDC